MGFVGLVALMLIVSAANPVSCHHRRHGVHADDREKGELPEHAKRYAVRESENVAAPTRAEESAKSSNPGEARRTIPFSERRLEKMLEKAILKIITGDLSTGDMLLLKSLNYSLEEVLAIRERELDKRTEEEPRKDIVKPWARTIYADREKKSKPWSKNFMDPSAAESHERGGEEEKRKRKTKKSQQEKSVYKDFDFEAYNRQAILDYDNLPPNAEIQSSLAESTPLEYDESTRTSEEQDAGNNLHRDFDHAMEPHVVFKIRYDDSEFDSSSGSDEHAGHRRMSPKHRVPSTTRRTSSSAAGDSFHVSTPPSILSSTAAAVLPLAYQLADRRGNHLVDDRSAVDASPTPRIAGTANSVAVQESPTEEGRGNTTVDDVATPGNDGEPGERRRVSEYEGLEWVEDDVYRVIPEFVDSLGFENAEDNGTSDYDDAGHDFREHWNTEESENDTLEYQNDAPDPVKVTPMNGDPGNGSASTGNLPLVNLSTYLQIAIAHRRGGNVSSSFDSQGEKAIEDIKSRVLALTGRFNLSSGTSQVQRERLTMFSPTCQMPRNTDQDAWTDPFSMNMHFQLNLTSGDHVVAAKLRIFKLPQVNATSSGEGSLDEEEEDEKIRISVYYYTKSLKRHRSKKRLMDSVVTPLTSNGGHLALDVRQGLRFWRLNPRSSHTGGSNHGLAIQVEDQDGKPLKPSQYIQPPSCAADQDSDQKTSEYLHSSYKPVLVTFAS